VFGVPCSFTVTLTSGRRVRADQALKLVPPKAWNLASCGAGSKGERTYRWAWIATASQRHHLLVRRSHAEGRITREALDARLHDYDQVLLEWNDELNARLAIVGAYFGRDLRDFLDRVVYEDFKSAGQHLETLYRTVAAGQGNGIDPARATAITAKLNVLNDVAYRLSFTMMVRIREGTVGRRAPAVIGETAIGETTARSDPDRW